ncbi:MAG: hypothetical protein ACLKAL_10905 [Alkaliphilus sp.]
MKKNENKYDRFVRIGESRTNKIIDMIRLLGNCSNKNTYEYKKNDIDKIFAHIEAELKICKARFEMVHEHEKRFRLK